MIRTKRGIPVAAILAGGISRHGSSCRCDYCAPSRSATSDAVKPIDPTNTERAS